ncbi:MAG TPA: xanthine dehydrogenase family protein subunit M [Pseudomonadota bacterium]|nr:xanthine dehydrogenase family protein subunit M [Pseudomonadota bacterium]
MNPVLSDFVAHTATSLADALALLSEPPHPQTGPWKPLAGGTDLMVQMGEGRLPAGRYVDLFSLPELRGIEMQETCIQIGALTTYSDIRKHQELAREFPLLAEAARMTGALAIQNRGTLGGNIANASPAADTPPALLVYDAELQLCSQRGIRTVPYSAFHVGYKRLALQPGELISKILLPRCVKGTDGHPVHYYRKVGTRAAQAISKVCFAGFARKQGDTLSHVRIALGSVAPTPVRCPLTESFLASVPLSQLSLQTLQKAQATLAREISPIDDIRSTAAYRRKVAQNLLTQFIKTCQNPAP